MVEICCGSYYDAMQAYAGGAKRIELNSGLHLGGLTPSLASLELIKERCNIQVVAMVRPRGAGFCYSDEDFRQMEKECEQLVRCGADGIAFGCLKEDASIDVDRNMRLISIIHSYGKEAVFHRAFDCSQDPFKAMETLLEMDVDRVLTSGLKAKAMEGADLLKRLQADYGSKIEILAGSGVNASNARELMEKTGVLQVHSSCKDWKTDKTTSVNNVSYSFAPAPNEMCYDVVSKEMVRRLLEAVGEQEA